jgi:3-isopropylmalate/(R)-2-methylmalate dehydratase small subunit
MKVTSTFVVVPQENIDTDQIIPARYLKTTDKAGLGVALFADWREAPGFPLNQPDAAGARVLVAGHNFGCGSSREHAPWALEDAGFRVVVASSFADIFRTNCAKIGLLTVELPEPRVRQLIEIATEAPDSELTVDLEAGLVRGPGIEVGFAVDPFVRDCLLNGWDEIALSLKHDPEISAYEAQRPSWLPRTEGAGAG